MDSLWRLPRLTGGQEKGLQESGEVQSGAAHVSQKRKAPAAQAAPRAHEKKKHVAALAECWLNSISPLRGRE